MTELYLLRHGIAVLRGTSEVPDDERPLTPEGEKRMRQIGRGLRQLDLKLDRIVSSPLARALRTAEIVADALKLTDRLETVDALRANQNAAAIRDWVRWRTEDRLMLVGHNPAFVDLIGLLTTGGDGSTICELRKGGLAALVSQGENRYRLDWLARPRLLRRLAK